MHLSIPDGNNVKAMGFNGIRSMVKKADAIFHTAEAYFHASRCSHLENMPLRMPINHHFVRFESFHHRG
jgi:hypothetical protein